MRGGGLRYAHTNSLRLLRGGQGCEIGIFPPRGPISNAFVKLHSNLSWRLVSSTAGRIRANWRWLMRRKLALIGPEWVVNIRRIKRASSGGCRLGEKGPSPNKMNSRANGELAPDDVHSLVRRRASDRGGCSTDGPDARGECAGTCPLHTVIDRDRRNDDPNARRPDYLI